MPPLADFAASLRAVILTIDALMTKYFVRTMGFIVRHEHITRHKLSKATEVEEVHEGVRK